MDSAEAQPETLRGACRGVQRHLGDAKFVTKILEGGGKEVRGGGKIYLFVSRENKRMIKPIKQSNNLLIPRTPIKNGR